MPNWRKVITSGSNASLSLLTVPGPAINNLTASVAINALNTYNSTALNSGTVQQFATPTASWYVQHNLEELWPIVTVWQEDPAFVYNIVIPNSITSVNSNAVLITFTEPIAGYVNVSRAGHIVSGSVPWVNLVGPANVTASLNVNGGITGSLLGSASYALTASYVDGNTTTASYVNPLTQSVLISGSLTVEGNTFISGAMRLYQIDDANLTLEVSSSYIYTTTSINDILFARYQDQPNVGTTKLTWYEGNLRTGLINGCALNTIPASSTQISITSGSGIIVDTFNNYYASNITNPQLKYIEAPTQTISLIYLSTYDVTYLALDEYGQIIQQPTPFTIDQTYSYIPLGYVTHYNRSSIGNVIFTPQLALDNEQNTFDNIKSQGTIKISGLNLKAGAFGLTFDVSSGSFWSDGANAYGNGPVSIFNAPSFTATSFYRYYASGSTVIKLTNTGSAYTNLDPTKVNLNNSGVLTTVTSSRFTIQKIFLNVGGSTVAYYGSQEYTSIPEASANLNVEAFIEDPETEQYGVYLGSVILRGNATSFSDTSSYQIIPAGATRDWSAGTKPNQSKLSLSLENLFGTASYSQTASYINPLTQTVIITGSLNVSGSTIQIGNNTLTGNTQLTGSIGVSGSQTFVGNQTLTGSFLVSGSTVQVGNNTLLGNTLLTGSITISGSYPPGVLSASVNIFGDTAMSGFLRFNPYSTNIDQSISASYIFVSGSTNDLYFSQNGQGYANTTRLRWIEGNMYTGLLNGGLITSQSSTVYQVSSGSGIIVNLNASLNSNPYPTVQYVNWSNLSASINSFTSSYQQCFVAIDDTGNIFAQGTPFYDGQFDTLINIGNVLFQNQSTINGVKTQPSVGYGFEQGQNIFNRAFGALKLTGYTLAPSGSSTGSLVVASGTAYAPGANYATDPNLSYYVVDPGTTTSKIFRYYQSGSTWVYLTNAGTGYATIDPTQYSNNGVLTPVPGTGANRQWSNQRCFWYPNSVTKAIVVYYGNATYTTEVEATANIPYESFTEAPNTAANAIYLGTVTVRNDGIFTDPTTYKIQPGGLFRQVGGSGGGGSVVTQTLAGLSDVSISGPTNLQPLAYSTTAAKWINTSTISASIAGNASTATTASYATSASQAQNANTASYALEAVSASYAATASFANSGFNIGISQIQTATVASSTAGANNLFTTSTGSFTGAKYLYTVTNGSNARTGEVLAIWNNGSVQFTDNSTLDIGSTTAVTASVAIVTAQAQLNFETNTSGWTIKSQATFI